MEHVDAFTFTWRIENFSFCPQQLDEEIRSPKFIVDFMDNTEWQLIVYPMGLIKKNFLGVYLQRTHQGGGPEEISVVYKLRILSQLTTEEFVLEEQNRSFRKGRMCGNPNIVSRNKIFHSKSGLLIKDTLTVELHICEYNKFYEIAEIMKTSTKTSVDFWNSDYTPKKNQYSVRTRIKVTTKDIECPVKRFCALEPNMKLSWTVARVVEDEPSLDITFNLTENSEGNRSVNFEISRKNSNDRSKGLFVRCKIKTVGSPKIIQQQAQHDHYFPGAETDEVWQFPTFMKVKDLMEKEYFTYTNGVLLLAFRLSFSGKGDELSIKNFSTLSTKYCKEAEKPTTTHRSMCENMFESGKFSDVSLLVQGRVFKAHKNILGTRSDVFAAMFRSVMKEQQTGVVDITDMDPDTMEKLLKYIYTDVLDNLNIEDTTKLYTAADKYNITQLKYLCRCKLSANLCVSNVADVLKLADLHHDADLLDDVRNFIRTNAHDLFLSHNWEEFSGSHKELAANTVLQICRKNYFLENY